MKDADHEISESMFFVWSSHWFEVGGAQLEKGDVTCFHAPVGVQQHLNQNVQEVVGLFARQLSIK